MEPLDDQKRKSPRPDPNPNRPEDQRDVKRRDDAGDTEDEEPIEGPDEEESGDDEA